MFATPLVLWTGCGGDKSTSSSTCVAAGTLVATPRGWAAIEALQVGDPIFAVDLERGTLVATEVVSLRHARRECLALVADDGRELLVTPDHPVHVPEVGGYVAAGRVALRQAASLSLIDGALPEARSRRHGVGEHRLDAGLHDVFDVGVASEHHNFVAGGFVVHNKSTTCPPQACQGTSATDGESTTSGDGEPGTDTGAPTSGSSDATSEGSDATSGSSDATSEGSDATSGSSDATSEGSDATSGSSDATSGAPATFPCGEEAACLLAAEYCEIFHPGQREGMITHSCVPLPAACLDMPDCTCLEEQAVAGSCMPGPEGGLEVSVFAP
ncbi:hypothetical protein OV079_07470 [Nannocystis pusilla]|uniref:Hint domain-containing protein n=1 Tax=Nannocystis pusilla TaxID=889268 RepID=A0A9X3IX41_9BACT|nr:hypothetical protein [Nannocystis pusilla]MCY1005413.1 hypothetical protein [Nannocystis pusilla]